MNQDFQDDAALFFEPPVKKDAKYYRTKARECLKGRFWKLLLMLVIVWACAAVICTVATWGMRTLMNHATTLRVALLLALAAVAAGIAMLAFLLAPIGVRIAHALLQTVDGEPIRMRDLLSSNDLHPGVTFVVGLLAAAIAPVALVLMAVGSVLVELTLTSASPLILVGVLLMALSIALIVWALLRLTFIFKIRAEYPELGVADTLRNSITLTRAGGKRLIGTSLSFAGWYALALLITVLTDGIGSIALCPVLVYHQAALTLFYHDVAQRDKADEVEFPSIDPEDYDPDSVDW